MGYKCVVFQSSEEVDSSRETDGSSHVGCAGFKLVGRLVVDGLLEANRKDHVAAALVGWHFLKELSPAVENADTGGAIHLVAGQRVEIAAQRLYVHFEMRRRLCPVH